MAGIVSTPFYFTKKEIDGKGSDLPTRIRHGSSIVKIAGQLGLYDQNICTSLYLYHRLSTSNPELLRRYSSRLELVLVACLSLAMKIEETVKRLQDIYLTALGVLSNESQAIAGGSAEIDPKEMKDVKDNVMDMERILLEDIQFDVEISLPHRFAISFLKQIGFAQDEDLGKECWDLLNKSYLCPVSILYPPHIVALAAILCSITLAKKEIPSSLLSQDFYTKVSCEMSDVIDASKEILDLFFFMATSDDQKTPFGRAKIELESILENEEARRRLLERNPDAKQNTPRPSFKSNSAHYPQYRDRGREHGGGMRRDRDGDRRDDKRDRNFGDRQDDRRDRNYPDRQDDRRSGNRNDRISGNFGDRSNDQKDFSRPKDRGFVGDRAARDRDRFR